MKKKLRFILLTVLCLCLIGGVTGCAALDDTINEIKGNLVGNGYTIRTYDNYGSKVMTTTGDKINIQGNPVKTTNMEHLIKKIADISKEKDCPINLSITPDNKLTIMVATKKRIFRLLDADESEEYILNTIIEAIKTSEKGFTL